jgi:hypothetical protein
VVSLHWTNSEWKLFSSTKSPRLNLRVVLPSSRRLKISFQNSRRENFIFQSMPCRALAITIVIQPRFYKTHPLNISLWLESLAKDSSCFSLTFSAFLRSLSLLIHFSLLSYLPNYDAISYGTGRFSESKFSSLSTNSDLGIELFSSNRWSILLYHTCTLLRISLRIS